jgi:hypothetical protein
LIFLKKETSPNFLGKFGAGYQDYPKPALMLNLIKSGKYWQAVLDPNLKKGDQIPFFFGLWQDNSKFLSSSLGVFCD